MAENLITQAELQALAPSLDLSNYSVTTISGIIAEASSMVVSFLAVDGLVKASVVAERERVRVNTEGALVLSFRRRPVAEGDVSAIRLMAVDVNQNLTLTNGAAGYTYYIPPPGNTLVYMSNFLVSKGIGLYTARGSNLYYEVDYLGGFTVIPDNIKRATVLIACDIIAQDSNLLGAVKVRQGSYEVQFASNSDNGGNSMLMKRAYDILTQSGLTRSVIF